MTLLKWLLSHFSADAHGGRSTDDKDSMIALLTAENEALRRQEAMNMANREEINRLHREINDLKYGPTVKRQMAEMTYDELIDEAKKRRLQEQERASKTAQPHSHATSFQQRLSAPTRSPRRTSYPSHSEPPSMLPTYAALAAMHSSNAAAAAPSSTDCHSSSSSSYSDSGSSSSDSGSSSCDSGGGF